MYKKQQCEGLKQHLFVLLFNSYLLIIPMSETWDPKDIVALEVSWLEIFNRKGL